ncbi:hypothetical protein FGE88_21355 [Salmonella enterica subsp. enterica]|nr:hypothetical protein [Salmonella enterica subsp. enterica serovar Mbandaka]
MLRSSTLTNAARFTLSIACLLAASCSSTTPPSVCPPRTLPPLPATLAKPPQPLHPLTPGYAPAASASATSSPTSPTTASAASN